MKTNRIIAAILVAALLLASLSGCAKPEAPAVADEPAAPVEPAEPVQEPDPAITVTDMVGHEITLDAPAEKVVALSAADCEILCAVGAYDTLVGRGEYCNYPPEVLDVTSVQSGYETNIEQIIALAPQVLIMSTMDQTEEQVAQLEAAGIKVVVSDADDIAGVYTSIELIGAITGKNDEAAAVIDGMKTTFAEVSALTNGDGAQTVYFEVSPLEYGLWTAGANTFMDEIANMLGLVNCFADVEGWAEISEEQVLERDPDLIVTISMYYGEGPTPTEEILSRANWADVTAVKNAAILNLQNDELSRPGPRLADGARALYEFAYVTAAMDEAA